MREITDSRLMRTRIKVCGIVRPEDAIQAVTLGIDALGLVFFAGSPRYVNVSGAQALVRVIPPFVSKVGLFLNAPPSEVREVLTSVSLDYLQFHGTETAQYCESFSKPYIKSVPMVDVDDLAQYASQHPNAAGFLLDAVKAGEAGGKGQQFDWHKVPDVFHRPLILAGGLNPGNVAAAIKKTQCYAVDVSSGVEAEKGKKSIDKMRKFVEQVKKVDDAIE